MMDDNTLDVIGMGFQHTEKREKIWDYSEYIYNVGFSVLNVPGYLFVTDFWS
jgi:hypothetical protein